MRNLIAAVGIALGALILALLIGLAASFRFYGTAVLGIAALILAPLLLLFGLWLKGHELHLMARFFMTASAMLILSVVISQLLPRVLPGTVDRLRAHAARTDDANARAALATLAPRAVPCRAPLVGQSGQTLYWWHPQDDPLRCYDRPGKHPEGKGELAAVDDAVAQLIVRQSAPKPTPPPPPVQVVYVERPAPVLAAPAPTPTPQPERFAAPNTVTVLR
jgi:hypothetical protein